MELDSGSGPNPSRFDAAGFPPRPIALRLLRSALILWAVLRTLALLAGALATSPLGILLFPALVLGLVWFDVRRKDEVLLFQNLAIRPAAVSLVVLAAPILLEIFWLVAKALLLADPTSGSSR